MVFRNPNNSSEEMLVQYALATRLRQIKDSVFWGAGQLLGITETFKLC